MDKGRKKITLLFKTYDKEYEAIFNKYGGTECPLSLLEERDIELKHIVQNYTFKLNKLKKLYKIKDF